MLQSEWNIRLKEARDAKGLTQQEVADQLGLSNMAVSGWERGVRKPRMNTLVRLSAIYSISVDYLLTGEQKPENSERREHMSMKAITEKEMERILQEEPDEEKVLEAVRRYRAQHTEDKDRICQLLCDTLKATREHMDLQGLYYQKLDSGDELVTVQWSGGSRVVTVTADSGIAMIRDILQAIK